jgi:hypothetical protein
MSRKTCRALAPDCDFRFVANWTGHPDLPGLHATSFFLAVNSPRWSLFHVLFETQHISLAAIYSNIEPCEAGSCSDVISKTQHKPDPSDSGLHNVLDHAPASANLKSYLVEKRAPSKGAHRMAAPPIGVPSRRSG